MVSSRSKTGRPACSRAVSEWKLGKATHATHVTLAECRAEAKALGSAKGHRIAGNEAKAQHLEHQVKTGKVGMKARAAKARELNADRMAKHLEGGGRLEAVHQTTGEKAHAVYKDGKLSVVHPKTGKTLSETPVAHAKELRDILKAAPMRLVGARGEAATENASSDPAQAALTERKQLLSHPDVRERIKGLFDEQGMNKVGGDVINAQLGHASEADLTHLEHWIGQQPPEKRGPLNRWLGGAIRGERRFRDRKAEGSGAESPKAPASPAAKNGPRYVGPLADTIREADRAAKRIALGGKPKTPAPAPLEAPHDFPAAARRDLAETQKVAAEHRAKSKDETLKPNVRRWHQEAAKAAERAAKRFQASHPEMFAPSAPTTPPAAPGAGRSAPAAPTAAQEGDKPASDHSVARVPSEGERIAGKFATQVMGNYARNGFTHGHEDFRSAFSNLPPHEQKAGVKELQRRGLISPVLARRRNVTGSNEVTRDVLAMAENHLRAHQAKATNRHVPFAESEAYQRATRESAAPSAPVATPNPPAKSAPTPTATTAPIPAQTHVSPLPAAPQGDDLAAFARHAHAAASIVTGPGRFGESKVFINHAHAAFAKTPEGAGVSLPEFKRKLALANHARHLDLSRADLVEAMNPKDVRESHTDHPGGGAEFNFIRLGSLKAGEKGEPAAPHQSPPVNTRAAADALTAMRQRLASRIKAPTLTADQLAVTANRAGGRARNREAAGDIKGRDANLAAQAGLRDKIAALKPSAEAKPFGLSGKGPAASFGNGGAGKTGAMFDEMKGAAAKDLPGQTTFREYQPPAKGKGKPPAERPDLHTQARPTGDVNALMAAHQAKRSRKAVVLQSVRAKLAAARRDPASHTDHPTGVPTPLKTDLIHFDPERFQYKLGHAAGTGSVGSLEGVKHWNPDLAGIMQVWKDPKDGRTYVINGHNRLDRAKRLNVPKVNAMFIHAENAEDAKAKGALTNIAEGRGTSIDAANFFKSRGIDKGGLEEQGIPMKEKVATEGLALAQLHPDLFRRVVSGDLHPEKAALVGGAGLNHAQQKEVVREIDRAPKARPVTTGHLKELLDNAKAAGTAKTHTFDLFGAGEEEKSLAGHRAKIQEHIKERLGREKRLFGTVAKSRAATDLERAGNKIDTERSGEISQSADKALQTFDTLKNRSGPVARALNHAAERIHAGENPRAVHDEAYRHVLEETRRVLEGGDTFAA